MDWWRDRHGVGEKENGVEGVGAGRALEGFGRRSSRIRRRIPPHPFPLARERGQQSGGGELGAEIALAGGKGLPGGREIAGD